MAWFVKIKILPEKHKDQDLNPHYRHNKWEAVKQISWPPWPARLVNPHAHVCAHTLTNTYTHMLYMIGHCK